MKISKFKLILIIVILLLSAKIIIALVALPKATVDYVAKYNELTQPADFIPEKNAADYYLRAEELYIEQSEELVTSNMMQNWPKVNTTNYGDIEPNTLQLFESWLISNKPAIDQIQLAIQKPYCWFERQSKNGTALGITFPESHIMGKMSQVFAYSAKLSAFKGDFKSATDNLIDSYRIGQHQCRGNLSMVEQLSGIRIKDHTISTAFDILTNSEFSDEQLKYFQTSLQDLISNEDYIPGLSAEKIFLYDVAQRVYLDWIRGFNRPSFRVLYGIRCMCGDHINNMWVNAFVGPSREVVLKQIDSLFNHYEQIKDKTPWQIHRQYGDQLKNIENINKSNFFMRFWGPTYHSLFSNFQEADSQTEALIAVLGILRFKANHDRLPETLQRLLSKGYIDYLPKDSYSESVLIYKTAGDNFRLYSVGKNFEDNGGETIVIEEDSMIPSNGMMGMPGMPISVDHPPTTFKRTVYKDIVYWPVSDIPEYVDRNKRF